LEFDRLLESFIKFPFPQKIMPEICCIISKEKSVASRTYESVVRQATCAVKNLILAMNGEKPIAQVNPEVPVKKVV
jgi:hypothetical protein